MSGVHPASTTHPRRELDDLLQHGVRLSVLAALRAVDRAEFSLIRDTLQISDSVLSKQMTLLESAGYLRVEKGHVGKRPRTWLSLTSGGADALKRHLAALRSIAGD